MLELPSIAGAVIILTLEGMCVLKILKIKFDWLLEMSLGYPLGALVNVLLFFVLHLVGLPLTLVVVGIAHVVTLGALFFFARKSQPGFGYPGNGARVTEPALRGWKKFITIICVILLAITIISSIVYALHLPLFYWDSFTNWHYRSMLQLDTGNLVFEGLKKPHYPILIHSLHEIFTMGSGWNVATANMATLILSFTIFSSIFLLIQRQRGTLIGLLTVTALTTLPLATTHLRQGYADIHVASYLLLAAMFFDRRSNNTLTLSALFTVTAAWTKLEGLYFGVGLWILLYFCQFRTLRPHRGTVLLVLFALPWPLFVLAKGMSLSPHGGGIELHFNQFGHVIEQLFFLGSFGVHWYVISIALVMFLLKKIKPNVIVTWGILSLSLLLAIYLGTGDVDGLVNQNGFSRTALIPTLLLTLGILQQPHHIFGNMKQE